MIGLGAGLAPAGWVWNSGELPPSDGAAGVGGAAALLSAEPWRSRSARVVVVGGGGRGLAGGGVYAGSAACAVRPSADCQ